MRELKCEIVRSRQIKARKMVCAHFSIPIYWAKRVESIWIASLPQKRKENDYICKEMACEWVAMGWKNRRGTYLVLVGSCHLCCPPRKHLLGLSYTSGQSCLPAQGVPARMKVEKNSIKRDWFVKADLHKRSYSLIKGHSTYPVPVNAGCSRVVAGCTLKRQRKKIQTLQEAIHS